MKKKKHKLVNHILGLIVVISLIGYCSQSIPALTALIAYFIGIAVTSLNKTKQN